MNGPAPESAASVARPPFVERRSWRRRRLEAWWMARRPSTDIWVLGQRNVYILPTAAGMAFAATLLLLLLASANYQLNLGFALTFLLVGAAVVSMHMTHNTLRGLTLRLRPPPPCFAGEPAALEVVVSHEGAARHGVGFQLLGQPGTLVWVDVPHAAQASANLRITAQRRGLQALPAIRVETRFPFGLFRAWTIWRPATPLLAYPRPESPCPPLPAAASRSAEAERLGRQGRGELDGVRAYRRGDSLRQIAWKKMARTGELISRDGQTPVSAQLWLDLADVTLRDPEDRMSRLCAWVLEAERRQLAYGLRLGAQEWAPSAGREHQHTLLQALARWH